MQSTYCNVQRTYFIRIKYLYSCTYSYNVTSMYKYPYIRVRVQYVQSNVSVQ